MPKPNPKTRKPHPVVSIHIEPGKVSPMMRAKWIFAWQKIIAEANEAGK